MTRVGACWSLSILLVLQAPALARAASTALVLVEEAGVAREHAPARASVPLPAGALTAPTGTVVGPSGPLPTQLRVLARWPDGSIRWLDARFLATIGAGARQGLRFDTSVPPAAAPPVTVDEHDDRVELATGPLRFSVRKDRFDPLANLVYDGAKPLAGPLALHLRRDAGNGGDAEPPERVRVSDRGPLFAVVTLGGRHRGGFRYELELRVFAGEPLVELTYTFTNATDPPYTDVREIGLALPLAPAPARRYLAGIEGARPLAGRMVGDQDFRLLQESESRFAAGPRGGKRAAGWLDTSASRRGVLLAATDFWEEYPKALYASRDGLAIDFWPAEASRPAHVGTGVAKSQTVRLLFHAGGLSNPAIAALAAATRAPLEALPAPTAVAGAGVENLPAPDGASTPLLDAVARSLDRYVKGVAQERWNDSGTLDCSGPPLVRTGYYGMLNWGDWNFPRYMDRTDEGCDTWGNLEYDLPQVLGLALLATGNRAYRPLFEAAARHFRDVDVIHYSQRHPEWVGMNHPHKPLHFDLREPVKLDLGHTWAEGLFTHYYLTGDARSLAVGRAVADCLARMAGVHPRANPRQSGWPAIALVSAYRATGDYQYLAAARAYAAAAMARVAPDPGDDWKMCVLADGLSYVHAETGDREVASWLLAYADALTAASDRLADIRYYPALAYAAMLSGRPAYRAAAAGALARVRIGNWGKPIAANGRAAFRIAYLLGLPPRGEPETGGPTPTPSASSPGASVSPTAPAAELTPVAPSLTPSQPARTRQRQPLVPSPTVRPTTRAANPAVRIAVRSTGDASR